MEKKVATQNDIDESYTVPIFGYELLRDILIPDLLGKDTPEITYWSGKHLARKFPVLSKEESESFFQDAGWGQLRLSSESKNEMKFELSGDIVQRRLQMLTDPSFRLEAGFIAQQVQIQKQVMTEAYEEIVKKQNIVIFTVRWDPKDPIE
ncbi:YslB family protein [Bacillus sp. FSL K6-3431]|uniref:YslB family protein n=1 Tax=Bacillus sp. FSL K6-3431 TaxID=2921500 RepID=UPI0030FAC2DB